jgi:uncharacterized membrane protein YebE (DUF533 family)
MTIDSVMLVKAKEELAIAQRSMANVETIIDTLYASHAAEDGKIDETEREVING